MATRQVSTRNIVGLQSLSFIRPQVITFTASGTKPSTRMYAFFDGVSVDAYITPSGGSIGGVMTSNSSGSVSGTFTLPAMTFNTGDREFKIQDNPTYNSSAIPGSTLGSCVSNFTATGMKRTIQETINTITTNTVEVFTVQDAGGDGGAGDPLAQSFFTYGVTGGCYITKIDIFFQSKDSALPVTLELREMQNGYPSSRRVSSKSVVTLAPTSVNTSATAATATTFTFSQPIYLEENRDYCFVLLANSNAYNVWTSKLGEKSIETGGTIFEQPFIGTLFKSENNITWSAEQTEDIKFTLYKANFTSNTADVTFKAVSPDNLLYGSYMSVTSGSPVVTMKLPFQHSHKTGEKLYFERGITNATYRGITNATMLNVSGFTLTVVDSYTMTFSVGTNATSTGTLTASGGVDTVFVDASGSGYVAPSISFTGGGGTGAAATATVVGGKIVSVNITSRGTGYTSSPTASVTDASGTGAVLVAVSEAIFGIRLNRKFQNITPIIYADSVGNTSLEVSTRTSDTNYIVGTHTDTDLYVGNSLTKIAALVTPQVESVAFGSTSSTEIIAHFTTNNTNVSPIIDLSKAPLLKLRNFLVNGASNLASETSHTTGTALSRYISNSPTLAVPSKGVRVFVNAASVANTSFAVFIRTSVSGSTTNHNSGSWVQLTCKTLTNLSKTIDEFKDYEFNSATLNSFDVYDIKIVLFSENQFEYPRIKNYRAVLLAT